MANPNYVPVNTGGLGAEIINYFLRSNAKEDGGVLVPRTIHDFLDDCGYIHYKNHEHLGLEIRRYIQNLINEAILYSVGFDANQTLPYSERLISYQFSQELAAYGSYEYAAFGYPEVRRHFGKSVLPIWVASPDCVEGTDSSQQRVGTCFVASQNRIVTARHCLPKNTFISIPGWDPGDAPLNRIVTLRADDDVPPFTRESGIDLAVLEFANPPFPDAKPFGVWTGEVLHDVLCFGYPPMKGFDTVLVTGTGEIVGCEHSTVTKQEYLIFNARVKGGNSGGPIVNRLGKVVGVVTEMLTDDGAQPDILGYGLATPASSLFDLLKACDCDPAQLYEISFSRIGGLRIL